MSGRCAAVCGGGTADPLLVYAAGPAIHVVPTSGSSRPRELLRSAGAVQALAGCAASDRLAFTTDVDGTPAVFIGSSTGGAPATQLPRADDALLIGYSSVALSNDGTRLVTIETAPTLAVIVWDVTDLAQPAEINRATLPSDEPYTVSFSPNDDCNFVAVSSKHALVYFIEFCGENLTALTYAEVNFKTSPTIQRRGSVIDRKTSVEKMLDLDKYIYKDRAVVLTSQGWATKRLLYFGTAEGALYSTNLDDAQGSTLIAVEVPGFEAKPGALSKIVCVADGTLVAASEDGNIHWINVAQNCDIVRQNSLPGQATELFAAGENSVAVSGSGFAMVCGAEEPVMLVDAVAGELAGIGIAGSVHSGHVVVAAAEDGRCQLRDCNSGSTRGNLNLIQSGTTTTVTSVACSPTNGLSLFGFSNGRIAAYDVLAEADSLLFDASVHTGAVTHMLVENSGRFACSVGGGTLVLFDTTTMNALGVLSVDSDLVALAVTTTRSTETRIALLSSSGKLTALSVPTILAQIPKSLDDLCTTTTAVGVAASVAVLEDRVYVHAVRGDISVYDWSTLSLTEESLPGHVFAAQIVTAAAADTVFASAGSDGLIMARSIDSLTAPIVGIGHCTMEHGDGARVLVALSGDGRTIVSAGDGGEYIAWNWTLSEATTGAAERHDKQPTLQLPSSTEPAALDAPPIVAAFETAALQTTESKEDKNAREKLLQKVQRLREKVLQMISENEDKPEIERLERDEFQLDLNEQSRLLKEGEQKLEALKDEIELKILAQQFLRYRIKKMCWDSMEVTGKAVYTYNGKLEVSNFPMMKRTKAEDAELKKILFARKVEISVAVRSKDGDNDDDEEEEDEFFLYNHLHLNSSLKKRNQIVLLRNAISQTKAQFNARHEEVCADKISDSRKIVDKNDLIQKVVEELNIGGVDIKVDYFTPTSQPLENPENLLTVSDSEIKVERVLNAAERAEKEEADRIAEEKRRLAMLDNPRERGLEDMMDGRLEGKGEMEIWEDIPQPTFMSQIPADTWSDAQKLQAETHLAAVTEREEMREKRRKALQSELAALQESVASTRKGFDDRVEDLFFQKIKTQQQVLQHELRIVLLLRSLQFESDALGMESELMADLTKYKDERPARESARKSASTVIAELTAKYSVMEKADKALEKKFKQRMRDLPDAEPHLDHFVRLYKARKKQRSKETGTMANETVEAPELDLDVDRPDGISDETWCRFLELREAKIKSESTLMAEARELAKRQSFLDRRSAEEASLDKAIGSVMDKIEESRKSRLLDATDVEILVPVKQGQMEVTHTDDFNPEYADAALLPVELVDGLNEQVLQLGKVKVDHLKTVMDMRKSIHMLEWENKRLDMLCDDHRSDTKAVQLMRVTKDISLEGANITDRHRRENEALERAIAKLQETLDKTVQQRRRNLNLIKRKRKALAEETDGIMPGLETLEHAVEERQVVHAVYVANRGPDQVRQRLKSTAAKRRLSDVISRQKQEIAMLQTELERLRMKTFPAFTPGQRAEF